MAIQETGARPGGTQVQRAITTVPPPSGGTGRTLAPSDADRRLAEGLGYFSFGLGLAEIAAPGLLCRIMGIENRPLLLRLFGLRECAAGAMVLGAARPGPGLWSRVLGDALDLGALGAALAVPRRSRGGLLFATASVLGVTALDVLAATRHTPRLLKRGVRVVKTIAVNKTPAECYALWRDLENLARFMQHVESVRELDETRSHWVVKGPRGNVEWDAEIVRDDPDALISWRSLEGAAIETTGVVQFEPRPGGGALVHVALHYGAPAGKLGVLVAKLFMEEPEQQLKDDLTRFKQVIETGEVPTTEGQPSGEREIVHRTLARWFTGGVA